MNINLKTIKRIMIAFCLLAGITVLALAGLTWENSRDPSMSRRIPDYGAVPSFSLTERSGRTVTLGDLKGDVWIGDFIYTTCPGPCPLMTSRMEQLQHELHGQSKVRLVSVSVDPKTDTPAVLSRYATSFGADPNQWLFLTGSRAAIRSLARDGLHLTLEVDPNAKTASGQQPIVHSTRFVLVDGRGHLRGYYDSTDNDSMRQLVQDVNRLLGEKSS